MRKIVIALCSVVVLSSCFGADAVGGRILLPVIPQVSSFSIRDEEGFCDVAKAKIRCETSAAGFGEDGYIMELTPTKILISTGGKTGILRAKTTVAQLKEAAARGKKIPCGRVEDVPRCKVRGLVFTQDRSPDFLERVARAMNRYKMNVLCVRASKNTEVADFVASCATLGVKVVSEIEVPPNVTNAAPVVVTKAGLKPIYEDWEPSVIAQANCDALESWDDLLPAIRTLAQKSWSGKVEGMTREDFTK